LVAESEFVKLIARDGDEATPWPEDSLMRTWAGQDDDMKSATAAEAATSSAIAPRSKTLK